MRWRQGRRSSNIEDRRGGRMRMPGGRVGRAAGGGGIGVIIIAVIAMFFGVDPGLILNLAGGGGQGSAPQVAGPRPADDERTQFVATVLGYTEDTWRQIYRENGATYQEPTLVLFEDQVRSACGMASSASGPFYCPGDQKIYIDLVFFDELAQRFGAPGDFAQAYVIAHEVGHHIQTLTGTSRQVQDIRRQVSKEEGNRYSVMLELQADCYAGVWTHRTNQAQRILERGDIREALNAASAIGDDRLQRQARGYITPDSFTHGTSEQRARWFMAGYETGDIGVCDTFAAARAGRL